MKVVLIEPNAHLPGHFSAEISAFASTLRQHADILLLTPFGLHESSHSNGAIEAEALLHSKTRKQKYSATYGFQTAFYREAAARTANLSPDITHVYGYESVFPLWSNLRSAQLSSTVVMTLKTVLRPQSDIRFPALLHSLRSALSRFLLRGFADAYIVHTSYLQAEAESIGIPSHRIHRLPSGIILPGRELDRNAARKQLELPADKNILLFVGVMRPEKGIQCVLSMTANLPSDTVILIAGIGAQETASQFREMDKPSHSIIVNDGYIPSNQLATYFYAADAVMVAHQLEFAGESGVMMDAVRFQRPVLGTETDHTGDTIRKYGIGTTFTCDDAQSFLRAVTRITDEEWLSRNEIRHNLQIFREHHRWTSLIPHYLSVYEAARQKQ